MGSEVVAGVAKISLMYSCSSVPNLPVMLASVHIMKGVKGATRGGEFRSCGQG